MITRIIKQVLPLVMIVSSLLYSYVGAAQDYSTLDELQPVIVRVFMALVFSAGAILVFMIGFGIWKSSMALGDPAGLDAAKKTWSSAVFGFLVVLFFLVIALVAGSLVGKRDEFDGGVEGIISKLFESIDDLLNTPK